VTETKWTEFS